MLALHLHCIGIFITTALVTCLNHAGDSLKQEDILGGDGHVSGILCFVLHVVSYWTSVH